MIDDDGTISRSTTESPRPDSRSATSSTPNAPASSTDDTGDDGPSQSHKPMATGDEMIALDSSNTGSSSSSSSSTRRHDRTQDRIGYAAAPSDGNRHSASYDMTSPVPADLDKPEDAATGEQQDELMYAPPMGYEFSNIRIMPTSPSSFLRPGSKFKGTQQSERQVYDVHVEIKYVDLRESFLCGYLRIQGLTPDNPTLTTYFEGEIIGSKYGFITKHEDWGATEKVDLNHWSKFTAFRPYKSQVRKGGAVPIANLTQRDNIFMRWKEHFLVPDHRVRTINGASFEGFYYICFNQKKGDVSGIYFHSRSEKFQQLELKHVPDRGCFGALEFR
jgi:hypothetical protein